MVDNASHDIAMVDEIYNALSDNGAPSTLCARDSWTQYFRTFLETLKKVRLR